MSRVKMATEQKTPTKLQKALDFKQKYEALITEAKEEALAQINEAVDSLKGLGLTYHVLDDEQYQRLYQPVAFNTPKRGRPAGSTNQPKAKEAPASPTANYNAEKFCKTCHEHGHDGRLHRGGKPKFTNEQLAELGVLPPALAKEA